jgi:PKD domain/Secretion system C-terminal sorting domain
MRYFFIFILKFLIFTSIYAQKHDYFWLSGDNVPANSQFWSNFVLDFNKSPVQIYPYPFGYFTIATQMCMADEFGQLLFFSEGCYFKNAGNQLIEGGESISEGEVHDEFCANVGYTTYQGMFSIQREESIYDVFHYIQDLQPDTANGCIDRTLLHSVVDMAENNGAGKVLIKDKALLDGCFQRACANRHANGRDWWIVMASNNQDTFYRFLVTPDGIKGPWTQSIVNPTRDDYWYCGWSEFSPDGNKFMINHCRTGVVVYDFDRCSGLLSDQKYLEHNISAYNLGACFSPNSRYIYYTNDNSHSVFQADLFASDFNSSQIEISKWDSVIIFPNSPTNYGWLQRGPDGMIYIWAGTTHFLHRIGFPNRKGLESDAILRFHQLPFNQGAENLYYPNYRLGPLDGSSCDTLNIDNHPLANWRWDIEDSTNIFQVTFTDNSAYVPTSWHWDFGDGSISQDTSPVHIYDQMGVYNVCLIVCNAYSCDTLCREVKLGVVGVEEIEILSTHLLSIYPNPSANLLKFKVATTAESQFQITDLTGKIVLQGNLPLSNTTNQYELKIDGLPEGMYVLSVRDRHGFVGVKKVVIRK